MRNFCGSHRGKTGFADACDAAGFATASFSARGWSGAAVILAPGSLLGPELLPERIVHCWMVTHSDATEVTTTFFHWIQEHGFYSLLFLSQALGAVERSAPVHLTVVSNGMQALEGETLAHPAKAVVLGPCLVAPLRTGSIAFLPACGRCFRAPQWRHQSQCPR